LLDPQFGSPHDDAARHLRLALSICDRDDIGKAATPYIDLALNLLLAEQRPARSSVPD
jgi:hypothetical protein